MLTKKAKKELFDRIGAYAARRLQFLKRTSELQYKEMSDLTDLPQSRISEIVNNGALNEPGLIGLLKGGLLMTTEIIDNVKMTEQEAKFVKSFAIFENAEAMAVKIVELRRLGVDPMKALANLLEEAKKKIKADENGD